MKPKVCFLLLFFWAVSVQAFSSRPLLAVPDSLTLSVGGIKAIYLSGIHSQNLKASIEDEKIVLLTSTEGKVFVKGLSPGSTRIQFIIDDLIRYTKVYVKESVGEIPNNF